MKKHKAIKLFALIIILFFTISGQAQIFNPRSEIDISFSENEFIVDIKAMDLNNDGADELIFLTSWGVQYYAYRWYGGHFENIWYNYQGFSNCGYGMQVTDFDNDGKNDLLVSWCGPEHYLSFLKNHGDIFIDQGVLVQKCPREDFCTHDFNGDSLVDLAIGSVYANSGYSIELYKHNPNNNSVQYMGFLPDAVNGSNLVKALNINNDEKMDILGAEGYSGILYTYVNKGDFNFVQTYTHQFSNHIYSIETADFNNDGLEDFVAAEFNSKLQFFINEGEGEYNMVYWGSADEKWFEIEASDINHDGKVDLIAMSSNCHIYFFKNLGDFNFEEMIYPNTDTLGYRLTLGDFDGNGEVDLVYGKNPAHVVFNILNWFVPVSIDETPMRNSNGFSISQNVPNPFEDFTTIQFELNHSKTGEFTVFDKTGKIILKSAIYPSSKQIKIPGEQLKPGIYLYQLKTDDGASEMKKMIKL